ncbi:unnamed protein product [Pieris brassicae]|uniref:Uncharacterized protein n=1 Tax=Pieris brassicae TaxID=7116 RepID=A0A9P0TML3_PIEBR|nr:unnamed protein product [Pieris brassicae]
MGASKKSHGKKEHKETQSPVLKIFKDFHRDMEELRKPGGLILKKVLASEYTCIACLLVLFSASVVGAFLLVFKSSAIETVKTDGGKKLQVMKRQLSDQKWVNDIKFEHFIRSSIPELFSNFQAMLMAILTGSEGFVSEIESTSSFGIKFPKRVVRIPVRAIYTHVCMSSWDGPFGFPGVFGSDLAGTREKTLCCVLVDLLLGLGFLHLLRDIDKDI